MKSGFPWGEKMMAAMSSDRPNKVYDNSTEKVSHAESSHRQIQSDLQSVAWIADVIRSKRNSP